MGLDMYLSRKSYVKNWDWKGPENRHDITVLRGGQVRTDIKPERICCIVEEVAYWRQANAIHRWFVDYCQDGKDDCRESYVGTDQLAELVATCKRILCTVETVEGDLPIGTTYYPDGRVEHRTQPGGVIAQASIAASLLPTQSGCFFGSTEYNDFYLDDLRDTIRQLEPLLGDNEGEYYYRASW